MENKIINCIINKKKYSIQIDPRESLLEMLRNKLGLIGTKEGCGVGECGACSVNVDGTVVDSCIYLAIWADGKEITTIEGISKNGELNDVQKSFIEKGAVQCGFCTPGLIISATNLLEKNKKPSRKEIRRGLSGNLCRCTGYQKIIEAVEDAAEKRINKNK